jgi:mannosyltransferase
MSVTRSTHPEEVHDVSPTTRAVVGASTDGVRAVSTSGVLVRLRTSVLARDVALASLVSLILGLIRLGAPSLWEDEAFTWAEMQYSLGKKLDVQLHFLHLVLVEPWAALAGTSEWALRFPSVIGATVAVGSLVVLANKLFDRRVALVSGLLLAASPFFVKWSQQARAYSMFVALCLVAMLLLLRAFERNSRSAWAVFGLALSVVIVWHPVSGCLMLPAYAVFIGQRRERFLPHGLLSVVIVAILAVPWAGTTAMRSKTQMSWIEFPTLEVAGRAVLDASGAVGIGLVLAGLGLWVLRRTGRSNLAVWLGAWALCPFALALLVSTLQPIFVDRFLIATAPAFAILAAVGLLGTRPWLRWAAAVAVVLATAIGLAQWYAPKDGGNWRGEDWRTATHTALELKKPGDDVVVVPWWAYQSAEYYGAQPHDTSTADSIWVLNWSETGHELPPAERAPLGFGDHVLVEEHRFGWRLSLQLWERPGTP